MLNNDVIQARSKVWIWGGAFSAKVDLFRVLSGRKWDFLRALWEKVDVFACFFGEGGLFRLFTACQGHVLWSNF